MRQRLLWATAVAAIAAAMGSATAAPLGEMRAAMPAATLTPVQYWGGWGPRYEQPYAEPYYGRRYITPDDDDDDGMIAPGRAIAITRSMGFRAISRPRLAGRAWVVEAVGPQGQRTRVSINAYTGAPLAIRELEPGGQRFPTPPVWRDERPSFGRDTERNAPPFREGRLDNDPQRLDPLRQDTSRPDQRIERPGRPGSNITARVVPVPTPRPSIDGDLSPQPQMVPPVASPPPSEGPAPQPPAARLAPRNVTPVAPQPPAAPPLSVEPTTPFTPPGAVAPEAAPAIPPAPEPPTAALPVPEPARPVEPAIVAPPRPPVVVPAPEAARPVEPAPPPAAALPQAPAPVAPPVVAPPAPAVEPPPVQAAPAAPAPAAPPAEQARRPAPEPDGVMIDGRFLGPNGEPLPTGPGQPATPGVRQVTPPPAGN